ncbi:MAG TPA: CRTAC1 family protein [Planctomycetota bacterium]|nr:CRTAC1 family protein [Planctomycetota bacterium]
MTRRFSVCGLALVALVGCSGKQEARVELVDVARASGIELVNVCGDPRRWYIVESNGNGAAWFDADADGDMDLFIANGGRLEYLEDGKRLEVKRDGHSKLYRNDGALKFTDVSVATGLDRTDWVNGVATADADNDGDTDLYLACFGEDVYLRNDSGHFVDATKECGLGNPEWGASAAFGDVDNDGDLDLYVANYCEFDLGAPPDGGKRETINGVEVAWGPEAENKKGFNAGAPDVFFENVGQGRFREATAEFGFALPKPLCSYAVVFSDVDRDGWQDVLVANDVQPSNLFHNDGHGRFREEGLARGFALGAGGRENGAMGLFVDDVDGDGDFDILRTNFDLEPNSLFVNDGKGNFVDKAEAFGLVQPSLDKLGWDGGFFDVDLDGDLDALVANGHVYPQSEKIQMGAWKQPTQLFLNLGLPKSAKELPRFDDVTSSAGPGLAGVHAARGIALGDPDNDGDVDALVVDVDAPPRLLENRSTRRGHWLVVRLTGKRSNRDGFGALITVKAGDRTFVREMRTASGLYSANDPRIHFGLGEVESIDWIEVRWPSGAVSKVAKPAPDSLQIVTEPTEENR